MKKALIILLCVLLALSACGEASPDPTSAPAQETQAAVTRMVSEPVAADFFARVTDVTFFRPVFSSGRHTALR